MTLRAAQFVGEKRDADRVNDIIQILLARHRRHAHRRVFPRAHAQEPSSYQMIRIIRLQLIAGNLFAYKLVIRLVGIKRAHHIIAITPRVRPRVVIGESGRVGIAHHIQPILCHLLAVMRTGQQPIDQRDPRRLGIFFPRRHKLKRLFRRRWQSHEIVRHPSNQRHRLGLRCHRQPLGQPRLYKGIHRMPLRRHRRFGYRLIGP